MKLFKKNLKYLLTNGMQDDIIYLKKFLNRGMKMALADTFKALSDAQRRDILGMLRAGRMSAGEIAEKLEITPAALSYHLKLLKKADLIMEYKEKNFVFYEVNTSIFDEMIMWMKQFGGNDNET